MQFFKNYVTFNEGLNRNKSIEELQYSLAELKKDKPNVKTILKHVNRVFRRSDVLDNKDIETILAMIHDKLAEKVTDSIELANMKNMEEYVKLDNYIKKLDERGAEAVKNTLAQYQKMVDSGEIKEEAPKKEEVAEEKPATEKDIDTDKIKNLLKGTKVTAKSAPQLSKTLVKTELPEVKALQQFLADKGFLATSEAVATDGYFGDKTATAVMAYQKSKGLKEDGIVGTNTWKAVLSDIKMDTDKDFKAFQLNSQTPKQSKVETTTADKKDVDKIKNDLSKTGLTADAAEPKSIDKIAEILAKERMTAFGVDSDEENIYNTLLGQLANGVINTKTITDLENKYKNFNDQYKNERKNGLFADLIEVFDTNANKINTSLQNQFKTLQESDPEFVKTKQSVFQGAMGAISNKYVATGILAPVMLPHLITADVFKSFSDDTAKCVALFIAFVNLKNATVNTELKNLKINVDLINNISALATKLTAPKPEESKNA